jgi:pyruvate/2-oxoglutarate dehydrogenase complex dihydrolipoamide dehydrogenase (E3) component
MKTHLPSAQSTERTKLEEYDLVILGGVTGSKIAAWTFVAQGQRVTIIDRKYIAGSCPNIACRRARTLFTVRRLHLLVRTFDGEHRSSSERES